MKTVFKTINTEIKLNTKSIPVVIYVTAAIDEYVDLSWADETERKKLQRKLELGLLDHMFIAVSANALGCEGLDSIGGVFVSEPEDIEQTLKDHQMISNALEDLKKNMLEQFEKLSKAVS